MKKTRVILLFAALIMVASFAFAATDVEYVQAYRATDMNFEVDGQPWQPRDVDGSLLYPIVVNGRSYVPVRSLLEAKGVTVDWRDPTRTIVLDYSTIEIEQPKPVVPAKKVKEIVVVGSLKQEAEVLVFERQGQDLIPGMTTSLTLPLAETVEYRVNGERIMQPKFGAGVKRTAKVYLNEDGFVIQVGLDDRPLPADGLHMEIEVVELKRQLMIHIKN